MTRIYFATDIHGSTKCWKKFLNVGKFYEADITILGGDLTGKAIVPIVESLGGARASFRGRDYLLDSEEKSREFEGIVAMSGYYPHRLSPEENDELRADPKKLDQLFTRLMEERLREWLKLADERLGKTGTKRYVCPGNDDPFLVSDIFKQSSTVTDVSDRAVPVDENHMMVNVGWSNPTPWKTHRECSEEELEKRIEEQVSQLDDIPNSIFQLHAPPYFSQLDDAPKLDETLKIVYGETAPVGSTAVRKVIEKYQPLLGLHGHIHESSGAQKIGRTLCVNPGSAYTEGVLNGVVIYLDKLKVKSYYSVVG